MQFTNHSEGYTKYENGNFEYVYQYKDHLGNVRLSYSDSNDNGEIDPANEINEENNYYPFGLKHKGYNNVVSSNGNSVAQKFKYNGIEFEESLGLNLYEMDFRTFDPAIARFNGVDPVTHYSQGTSVAFDNNPIYWADPSGGDSETNKTRSYSEKAGLSQFQSQNLETKYCNKGKCVEVNDGINLRIEVNESDFIRAKFFANEINNNTHDDEVQKAYVEFYKEVLYYENITIQAILHYLFVGPKVKTRQGVPVGGEIGEWLIPEVKGSVTLLSLVVARIKFIQKHHILPRAVYKRYKKILEGIMKLNGGENLKKLPTPFHGNHPQYNRFVTTKIDNLIRQGDLTEGSIRALQKELNTMINKAYDSGMKLNDYFRKFN